MDPRFLLRFLPVALLASTLLAETTSPTPGLTNGSPAIITAAFWNIQWFPGRRPNASPTEENRQIRAVQRDISAAQADILAMEEVRDSEHASLAIQPLTGFKVDVCSNFPAREGQQESQQIAITSRLRPIGAWAESWKRGAVILPPRGFAFAAYQVSPHQVLLVYALHLKSNRGEIHEDIRIREESMHQVMGHIRAMKRALRKKRRRSPGSSAAISIPRRMSRVSPEKKPFRRYWQTVSTGHGKGFLSPARITMPSDLRYPPAAFDQIFYRGATLSRAWVANTSPQSSDHRAVNVVLNFVM